MDMYRAWNDIIHIYIWKTKAEKNLGVWNINDMFKIQTLLLNAWYTYTTLSTIRMEIKRGLSFNKYAYNTICTCICLACMDDKINVYIFQLASWTKWNSVPVYAFTKLFLNLILTVNKTKNFWLLSPTQLLTQGQWWSIFLMHLWQTLKRITKMSKIYQLVFVLLNLLEILSYCPA